MEEIEKMTISTNGRRIFIARHGETVFNKAARIQEGHLHTPLTHEGCKQAVLMGRGLLAYLQKEGLKTDNLQLIASDTGRTLQTLGLICGAMDVDYHKHANDKRLREIDMGDWGGCYYKDLFSNMSELMDEQHYLFKKQAPNGESYADVRVRLSSWIMMQEFTSDMLIISHGMTSRVLRGLLCGLPNIADYDAPAAQSLAQGSMVMICDGTETLIVDGDGDGETA